MVSDNLFVSATEFAHKAPGEGQSGAVTMTVGAMHDANPSQGAIWCCEEMLQIGLQLFDARRAELCHRNVT